MTASAHSVFDLVAAQPWAIVPETLKTIAAIARRENDSPAAVEARLGRPLQNARAVSMRDGVALVPVTGPVFRYANLFTQISGATSLDVLARDFTTALDDEAVKAVVLVVDSPGGQANGIAELSAMIRAGAARKPVIAYVDGAAQSAAYWLASAATEVVTSSTAMIGSIGAVVALDTEKRKGTLEIVSSQSPNKRPDVSTEAGRAQIQTLIDSLAQVFLEDVARYRGVDASTVLAEFGQGASFIGSEAVRRGMADRVSTLEEVIAGLAAGSPAKKGAPYMATEHGTPAAEKPAIDRAYLAANHPDLLAACVAEGAAAERSRILAIQALGMRGHEAMVAEFVADGQTSAPEAAVKILSAEKAANERRAGDLRAAAPQPVADVAAPDDKGAGIDPEAPIETRAQARWDRDPDLRAEFGAFNTYLAYAKAEAAGTVKLLSK